MKRLSQTLFALLVSICVCLPVAAHCDPPGVLSIDFSTTPDNLTATEIAVCDIQVVVESTNNIDAYKQMDFSSRLVPGVMVASAVLAGRSGGAAIGIIRLNT